MAEIHDPHTVAGLLKLHFREMRVSLISRGQPLAQAVLAVQNKSVSAGGAHSQHVTACPVQHVYWGGGRRYSCLNNNNNNIM